MHKLKQVPRPLRALLMLSVLMALTLGVLPRTAYAAGSASFSLSPASGSYTVGSPFTVTVYETSQPGDDVEGVQANVSYNTSDLQCDSVSESGTPFTYLGQSTCGSGLVQVGEAAASTVSGQQRVATISFTVRSAGRSSVGIATGSDIQNSSVTSVWNGADASASFMLNNPVPSGGGSSVAPSGSGSVGPSTSSTPSGSGSASPSSSSGPSGGPSESPSPSTSGDSSAPSAPGYWNLPPAAVFITVRDHSGRWVRRARVVIDGRVSVYTNVHGMAGFRGLRAGTHAVVVTSSSERAATSSRVVLAAGQSKDVSLTLTNSSSPSTVFIYVIAALVILGAAGFAYARWSGRYPRVLLRAIRLGRAGHRPSGTAAP